VVKPAVEVPLIGLTGGMGAGKSTALAALERQGAVVLSTDEVVHDLYRSDGVRKAVIDRWGAELAPGGEVDRAAVAERAFASEEDRAWLEALLWPLVGERMATWIQAARTHQPPPRAAVIEVPLLFESGMDAACDATIAIISKESLVRERTADRGHAAVDERRARQLSQLQKAERATFVVENDGSEADLERLLSAVLENLGA
jgi:dephospho-CoA kinase